MHEVGVVGARLLPRRAATRIARQCNDGSLRSSRDRVTSGSAIVVINTIGGWCLRRRKKLSEVKRLEKSSESNQSMTSPLSQDAAKTVFGSSTPLQCNLCVHHCLNTLVINKAHSSSRGGHAEQGTASTRPRDCDSQLTRRVTAAVIQEIPLDGVGSCVSLPTFQDPFL